MKKVENIFQIREEMRKLICTVQDLVETDATIYALPMFITNPGQTNYTIPALAGASLISVIIETNPQDVSGNPPEVTLSPTGVLTIPDYGGGQRVFVIYKNKSTINPPNSVSKVFFITSSNTSPATLVDNVNFPGNEVLKIEVTDGGAVLYEGIHFSKPLPANNITMIAPNTLLPNTKYLITIA